MLISFPLPGYPLNNTKSFYIQLLGKYGPNIFNKQLYKNYSIKLRNWLNVSYCWGQQHFMSGQYPILVSSAKLGISLWS